MVLPSGQIESLPGQQSKKTMALNILVLTHHFPPEVSAGALRFCEMAKVWVRAGHSVTVVACVPNHPRGSPYPGYRNRIWQRETVDGINVVRLWTYLARNKGVIRRSVSFASYFVSATLAAPFLGKPDVVISTIPHFFCGTAGYSVSRLRRAPWVLDVRDLWPESIVSVGAMKPGRIIRALASIERFCYRRAAHIVSASDEYLSHFSKAGVARKNVSVVTNGVSFDLFSKSPDPGPFRKLHNLENKFVASYVGTLGLAHGLDVVLMAADHLRSREDITFVLVGDGAERDRLVERCRSMALTNVRILPQVPHEQVPVVWAGSDAAIVPLRSSATFERVIPSKMFEAMALRRPIILGIRGYARRIVEDGVCGVTFTPDDADDLVRQVVALADNPSLRQQLGNNGYRLAQSNYDRNKLAHKYLRILKSIASGHPEEILEADACTEERPS
jgi:glycosyltransferase involved in cell wall biosynthesis